jgi:hypothetical protein
MIVHLGAANNAPNDGGRRFHFADADKPSSVGMTSNTVLIRAVKQLNVLVFHTKANRIDGK